MDQQPTDMKRHLIELMQEADRLEARFVKKFKTYKPHDVGDDGGQIAFHKAAADSVVRVVAAGNRWGKCLSFHTLIEQPLGESRTIGSLFESGESHWVWAWDGEKKTPILADPPFKKGAEECFRVWMEDGRWFECAGNHRVLTQVGWQFFSNLQQSLPCLPPTSLGSSPLARGEDVRRYLQTVQGCRDGCSSGPQPLVSSDGLDSSKIIAYQSIGIQDIYDFNVPIYHNYCTAGVVHHNSTTSINEMIWLATGTHPWRKMKIPNKGKMYGESFSWISQVLEPKLTEWVDPDLLDQKRPYEYNNQGGLTQINWRCGSVTYIGTYEQETRKAEGTDWDYIGFDEPPKKKLWIANFRGLIDRKGIAWIAGTMLDEPWIYDDLWEKALSGEKPYVRVFGGKSVDNPHNPQERIKMFADELSEDQREVRLNGGFSALSGLVINTYKPTVSDVDEFVLDDNFVIYEGIDPHSHKPHAVLWKAIDREGFRVVCGELKFEGSMGDFAAAIMDKRKILERDGAMVVKSVIDSAINQKDFLTRQNLYQELVRHFNELGAKIIPRIAKKGAGSLEETITILKDLYRPSYIRCIDKDLQEKHTLDNPYSSEIYGIDTISLQVEKKIEIKVPRQYIFRDVCTMYRRELLRYRWPKDIDGRDTIKPIDDNNEFISCDRYIEQTKPRFHILHDRLIRTYKHGEEERYQR